MVNLNQLWGMSRTVSYAKDAAVICEGEQDHELVILLIGQAGVYSGYQTPNQVEKAVLQPGDFIGAMSLFHGHRNAYTVVARTPSTVLRLNREDMLEFFTIQPEFTFQLLTAVSGQQGIHTNPIGSLMAAPIPQQTPAPIAPKAPAAPAPAASKAPAPVSIPPKPVTQAPAAPVSAPKPAIEQVPVPSGSCALFPEGHGSYTLPPDNSQPAAFLLKSYACPICRHEFKETTVRETKLYRDTVDEDGRVRFRDIEPLYYEIITCPKCWYSSLVNVFAKGMARGDDLKNGLAQFRSEFAIKQGEGKDTFSVFAGYYLALFSAPHCFRRPHGITGKLWQNLSYLYGDCGDETMSEYATQKALEDYMYTYEKIDMTEDQSANISLTLGELNFKLGNISEARKFFFQVKINKSAAPALRNQADGRLEDLRE
jgi:hypothetical protein